MIGSYSNALESISFWKVHYKFIAFIADYEEITIPPFANLVHQIQAQQGRKRMLLVSTKIQKKNKNGGF